MTPPTGISAAARISAVPLQVDPSAVRNGAPELESRGAPELESRRPSDLDSLPTPELESRRTPLVRRLLRAPGNARALLLADLIILSLAAAAAAAADPSTRSRLSAWLPAFAFPVLVLVLIRARRPVEDHLKISLLDPLSAVLGAVSLAAMLTLAVISAAGTPHPVVLSLRLWLFGAVYLGIERCVVQLLRRQAVSSQVLAVPTLVMGAGVVGELLVSRLSDPCYGLQPVGLLDSDPRPLASDSDSHQVPVLGGPENLAEAIRQTGAEHVIVAFSSEPDHVLVDRVRECEKLGVDVSLVPRLFEAMTDRATLGHVGGLPLLTLGGVNPKGWQFALKHAMDRGLALLALLLAAPLFAAIAALVAVSSPGPVLFRQRRIGRDGREFDVLKFRTMRGSPEHLGEADAAWAAGIVSGTTPAEEPQPLENRVTPVGRFLRTTSLDELPQLINVLRGEMSLVGPRPERVAYVRNFELTVARYNDRHRVKSGITGWAQVHGLRGQTSIADRVEWDNYYIQNWSLRLDLRIIFLTIAELLRLRG